MLPTEETLAEPTAIGDTDDYDYYLGSTTYSWIDATGGTNTGITDPYGKTRLSPCPGRSVLREKLYPYIYHRRGLCHL